MCFGPSDLVCVIYSCVFSFNHSKKYAFVYHKKSKKKNKQKDFAFDLYFLILNVRLYYQKLKKIKKKIHLPT